MPFADKLLSAIRQRKEAMMQEGGMPGIPEDLLAQINQGTNPQAMEMAKQAIGMKSAA